MASTADAEMAYSLSNYRRVTNIRIIAHFTHLRKFRNFVFATEVTIFSDYNALVYLRECAPKSAKLTRWALGFKNSCMLILIFFAFSALTLLVGLQEGHPACKKLEWWGAGVVIFLEQGADLHMAQLMPLPLTISCFSKIQIGLPFWYRLTRVVVDKEPLNGRVCVCACVRACVCVCVCLYCAKNN